VEKERKSGKIKHIIRRDIKKRKRRKAM